MKFIAYHANFHQGMFLYLYSLLLRDVKNAVCLVLSFEHMSCD